MTLENLTVAALVPASRSASDWDLALGFESQLSPRDLILPRELTSKSTDL